MGMYVVFQSNRVGKISKKKQSEGVRQSHNVKITLLQTAFLAIWEICSL